MILEEQVKELRDTVREQFDMLNSLKLRVKALEDAAEARIHQMMEAQANFEQRLSEIKKI